MSNEKFDHAFGMSFEESVSNVTATNSVELGTRVVHKGSEYVYVYNAESDGQIIPTYSANIITGASGYSVTKSATTDIPVAFVGVCVHNTITTGAYGWLLNKGIATVEFGTTVCTSVGQLLACSENGVFHTSTFPTQAAAGRGLAVVHGQAISTFAAGASGLAFVRGV